MYNPDMLTVPKSFAAEHPFDNGEMRIRDEKLAAWPRTTKEVRKNIADYYAMITHVDAQMGRVLATLKETGKAENTIIVFAGDNGLAVGRHGLMGKQNLYEHSVHVPLVIGGPGISKDRKCGGFCYLLDIFPTLCDLLGLPIPDSVKGKSFADLIRGKGRKIRETLFFAYKNIHRGLRNERYKLIEYNVKGKRTTQLFDLQSDPWELSDLSDNPKHNKHLIRLRKQMLTWKDELSDGGKFWQGYNNLL
jgi:arylsulfatase A-like enzyme